MTADEKRAHLALCGCGLFTFMAVPDESSDRFRIVRMPRAENKALVPVYMTWRIVELTVPERYREHPWSLIPDESLDRLELSLIEQFLNPQPVTR